MSFHDIFILMNTPIEPVKNKIHTIRGIKVMLDRDLAELYGVMTRNLNKAVKRNAERFPSDFMFQLNKTEAENFMFQNGTSSWGGIRKLPFVFTEMGVAMLSSVLKSKVAIEINIRIMRAFVEVRQTIAIEPEYALLKGRVNVIESQIETINSNNLVDKSMIERKITSMSGDIRRISEAFDSFQEGHIIIQKPDDDIGHG